MYIFVTLVSRVVSSSNKMNIHAEFARINQSLCKLRSTEIELRDKRDRIITQIAMEAVKQPPAATQIAQALIAVHTEHDVKLETLFGIQTPEVNTAGLLELAEWRNPETIEMFLKNGADVNAKNEEDFSVLELVLMGHDHHYSRPEYWNRAVFEVLHKYDTDPEVPHAWIIDDRCNEAPEYVLEFLHLLEPDE